MANSLFYIISVARVPAMALIQGGKIEEAVQPLRDMKASLNGRLHNAWLFQSNPALYDLRGALCSLKEQVWSVSRYAREIAAGDRVYLWEAGRQGGIAGIAEIQEPARLQPEPPEQFPFARVAGAFAGDRVRARLRILSVIEPLIARQTILSCQGLSALDVLRCSRGTNFRLSVGESSAIEDLIQGTATLSAAA